MGYERNTWFMKNKEFLPDYELVEQLSWQGSLPKEKNIYNNVEVDPY